MGDQMITPPQDPNLGQFILTATEAYRERPAFILKDANGSRRPLSFFEFNEIVLKIATLLRVRYKAGFKIGLWGENRVEWCALALATWSAGGTIVPLMHIATDSEIKNIIGAAKIDALFISPKLQKKDVLGVADIFAMDFAQSKGVSHSFRTLGDLLSTLRGGILTPAKQLEPPSDLAVLIFTSGTTGNPKGVMLSHKNIITNILDTLHVIPTSKSDRAVSILPLSHLFELVGGFAIAHIKGICITYPDSLKPEDVLREMKIHKATVLVAVPLFFEIVDRAIQDQLKNLPQFARRLLDLLGEIVLEAPFLGPIFFKKLHRVFGGHIKLFVTGGAKIDPEIILRFKKMGIQFLQGYGLTETSPIISFTGLKDRKNASVGKPVHTIKLKIADGEICVSGPSVFSGYFENKEATESVIKNGWFHTGDIGRLDEEGYLYITGRKKDVIVTANGKNIYPEELEETLKTSPLITEVAVLGLNSARGGEEVHAVVVPSASAPREPLAQREALWAVIEQVGSQFSDYKRIRGLTISKDELPKTATKKVRKHVLKEMITSGAFGTFDNGSIETKAAHTPLSLELEREHWLNEKLQQISRKTEIWREAHIRQDLGIDSLTFMELISAVETHWGLHIADSEFEKIVSVEDLLNRLGHGETVGKVAPKKEFQYRQNNAWLMNVFRPLVHFLFIRPLFRIFFRFRVYNQRIFQKAANWVATPNHASHLDLLAIAASVPLNQINSTFAVAADDYFFNHPLKAFFVKLFFNAIPFERRARIDRGFRVCEEILRDGGNLIIFPEGTRSPSGQMGEFKPGVGRLLASQGYSAIPIYIKGAHEAFPKGALLPKPSRLSVFVGVPVKFSSLVADLDGYQTVASDLQSAVEGLRQNAIIQASR